MSVDDKFFYFIGRDDEETPYWGPYDSPGKAYLKGVRSVHESRDNLQNYCLVEHHYNNTLTEKVWEDIEFEDPSYPFPDEKKFRERWSSELNGAIHIYRTTMYPFWEWFSPDQIQGWLQIVDENWGEETMSIESLYKKSGHELHVLTKMIQVTMQAWAAKFKIDPFVLGDYHFARCNFTQEDLDHHNQLRDKFPEVFEEREACSESENTSSSPTEESPTQVG